MSSRVLQIPRDSTGAIDLLTVFQQVKFFHNVPREALFEIATASSIVQCYSGQTLMEEGEAGTDVYLLLSGRVRVQLESISPYIEVGITKLDSGDVIGEMALVEESTRSATILAIEPCQLARIPVSALRALCDEKPAVGIIIMRNISQIISERLKAMNRRMLNFIRSRYYSQPPG